MNWKAVLGYGFIFGSGVGVGYLVAKKVLLEQYKEDVQEVKDFYYDKLKGSGLMDGDFEPDHLKNFEGIVVDGDVVENDEDEFDETQLPDYDEEYDERVSREYFEAAKKYSSYLQGGEVPGKGRPVINYNKPPLELREWGDLEDEDDDDYEDEEDRDLEYEAELEARADDFARRRHENRMGGLPYLIEYDEYMDGPEEYERQALYYYTVDRTLCEEDDEIIEIDEEVMLVGEDYEDILDMQTTAWVRNDTTMTLYEIYRIDESYQEAVAGRIETPHEREMRRLGRMKKKFDE